MKNYEVYKNRLPINEIKPVLKEFLTNQKILNVAINGECGYPIIDSIDYFYFNNQHIALIPPMSKLTKYISEDIKFTGFVQEGVGKNAKKFYATLSYEILSKDDECVQQLSLSNPMIKKMVGHKAKLLKLNLEEAMIALNNDEVYAIDNDVNPTFAQYAPNGKKRFENTRKVLMTYLDRNVIFNVFVMDDVYYCLTRCDSAKIGHIKNGGTCMIYDGKYNHFETVIEIVDEQKEEIFSRLVESNNAYFKENVGLTALRFKKM